MAKRKTEKPIIKTSILLTDISRVDRAMYAGLETVEEGNRLIAQSPFASDAIKISLAKADHHGALAVFYKELKYHSSWDWLMPVAEKIVNMTPIKGIVIQFTNMKEGVVDALIRADRAKIWASCVQFIQWYNTQTPQP